MASQAEPFPLRLRIGLHTGEPYGRDHNYFGPAVNRAARLMAAAHGGQMVCSAATAALAGSGPRDDYGLRRLGTYRLKDLLEPETIFQVEAPGVVISFPQLRTLDALHHNLPVQQTAVIGREAEIAATLDAFEKSRLVTLTGVGGCGKTRLALAAAVELTSRQEDGVFFVPLVSVTDEDGLVAAITQSMGVRLGRERSADLSGFLARRDVLLVLDNCEHLLDEVADLADEVLSAGAGPRVLATSREPLGIVGEHVIRVPSLPVESDGSTISPAEALLVERMRTATGDGAPVEGEHDLRVEICRRLDGIPLAIELAAAQLAHMTPNDLLERLDQRFDLLVGGHGRRRQRQQTLQAVMDWSWELLSSDERRLLAVVSVFGASWDLHSSEFVGEPFVSAPVAAVLAALVDKSLVEPVFAAGTGRYRLLETVRLFAAGKLVEFGLADRVRDTHAELQLRRARSLSPEHASWDVDVVARMQAELIDIGVAVDWLTNRGQPTGAAELVISAGGCYMRGQSSGWAVAAVHRLADHVDDATTRARLLVVGAYAAVCTGEHELTLRWATEAAELAEGLDAFAFSQAAVLVAAPNILVAPEAAESYLRAADRAARQSASPLLRGAVAAWLSIAKVSAPELDLPVADEHDAPEFGGRHSLAWAIARQAGAIRLADEGRRDDALALLQPVPGATAGNFEDDPLYALAVEAIAGDPPSVAARGRTLIVSVDRRSDVVWHAELVLILGIAHTRAGRHADGVVHIEVAKRAPMFLPLWYALARRFGRRARSRLDPLEAAAAIERAKLLTVEQLLDRELRQTNSTV
jgi:predicted ATPase